MVDPDSDSNVPDRHSVEMSVINGLKNLEDFRGEITLLNIENSPGPNHRKRRIFQFLSVLKQQKLKKIWALFDCGEHCVKRLQLQIRKLGKGRQNRRPGKLKLKAVAAAGEEYVSKGRCQKPQARKLSVGGVPAPPRGLHGREFSEKLAEKS